MIVLPSPVYGNRAHGWWSQRSTMIYTEMQSHASNAGSTMER